MPDMLNMINNSGQKETDQSWPYMIKKDIY